MSYIKWSFLKRKLLFFFQGVCHHFVTYASFAFVDVLWHQPFLLHAHCIFDIFPMLHVLCHNFPSNAGYHRDRRSRLAICRAQTGTRTLGTLDKRSWWSTFIRGCLGRKDIINCREREVHRLAFVSKSLREATKR